MLTTVLTWTGTGLAFLLLALMVLPSVLDPTGDAKPARDSHGVVKPALLDTHAEHPAKPAHQPRRAVHGVHGVHGAVAA